MSTNHYRRRLPHYRSDGATYFVTWRLPPGEAGLTPEERDVVAGAMCCFDGERYELIAYVVMDDHVHVLVCPRTGVRLQDIVHSWKSYRAYRLQRNHARLGRVCQEEYFDRIIRDEAELIEKMEYILKNPRKRWPEIAEYRWVWAWGEDDS